MFPFPRRLAVPVVLAAALTGCTSTSTSSQTTAAASGTVTATSTATALDAAAQSIADLLKAGIAQAQAGKTDQARTTFENVVTLDSGNKFAWYNLGLLAQTKGDAKTAVTDYDKALAADPSYEPALYNKAIALEPTDLKRSLAIYEQITAANPKASTAWLRQSFAYTRLGRAADAKAAREKALALDASLAKVPTPSPTPSK